MRSSHLSIALLAALLSLSATYARIIPSKAELSDLLQRLRHGGADADENEGVVVTGDCYFDVNGDLNDPAPLFMPHGELNWLMPNAEGVVEIKNGDWMDMYCSASFVAPFSGHRKISAQCLQRHYFLVDGLIYPLQNFTCTNWPGYIARRTGRECNGGTDLLEVGFLIEPDEEEEAGETGFLHTMDVCHNEDSEVTRYVHHVLYPQSAAYQHGVGRPRFVEGDFYGGKNVDQLYTKVQQNLTISDILGMDATPYFNDTSDTYLARGHMAAKVDFIFGAPQRATFFFVNAAPQWQAFNGGNWERVEDGVRKMVGKEALTADCYTGIWGVSTLPDVKGEPKELYLDFDENDNGLIPVPKIYFRVVIDRQSRKGIVLIGVNNPHASLEQIKDEYVICDDVSDRINWIGWAKDDLRKGYSYACSVPDFTAVVTHLPLEDMQTTGLLGVDDEVTTTTEEPTTTEVPTTEGPTTEGPTTEGPTTEGPTTEGPTTAGPTTELPTTEAPATESTAAPTTGSTASPTLPTVDPPHVYIDFY